MCKISWTKRVSLGSISFGKCTTTIIGTHCMGVDYSFWWKDCLKLLLTHRNHASCSVHSGCTTMFLDDLRIDSKFLSQWPHLHSFALDHEISIISMVQSSNPWHLFHLPLSMDAYAQFQDMLALATSIHLFEQPDYWNCSLIWTCIQFPKLIFPWWTLGCYPCY